MALSWREAGLDDAALLWRWANDAETRRNAFSKAPIPYDTHVAWLRGRLASGATRLWIFADADGPVGQVRFDVSDDVADIDIAVAPERRGRGHGRAMLREAVRTLRAERGGGVRPRAAVLTHNARSLAMFRACGFVAVGVERREGEEAVVLELREEGA
jgi:UDP-2,4-diacetamido-2,4,6-trideoxy-beta-L-altropyranose hydrolase